jgi:hypothetical protein
LVRNLAHYLIDLRWTLRKALDYEDRMIDGETTIDQLTTLARARGGHIVIEHQDHNEEFKITIQRMRIVPPEL